MQREEGRRQSGCLFLAKRWCLCVYVDASESSEFFVMLRKALPFLVYIIVVRGEVSVRLEDVIRTISVVKAANALARAVLCYELLSLSSFRNFSENASPKQDGFTPITSKLSSKPLRKFLCICLLFELFSFQREMKKLNWNYVTLQTCCLTIFCIFPGK